MLSFPLGSLNIQVALLYGEGRDALVMSGVELSQVLPKEHILESGSFIAMDLKHLKLVLQTNCACVNLS